MEELKACPYCKGYESAGFEGKTVNCKCLTFALFVENRLMKQAKRF